MAIDGNPATGWGIHPAVGQPHHIVFGLAQPLTLKAGARLTISLEQLLGKVTPHRLLQTLRDR